MLKYTLICGVIIMKKLKINKYLITILLTGSIVIIGSHIKELFDNNIYDEDDNLKISNDEVNNILDELSEELGKDLTEDDINYLMLYSVFTNSNLDSIDKSKLYNIIDLIEDNPYIDKDKVYKNLKNLKINYLTKDENINDNITGRYNYLNDSIEIYEDNIGNDVFYHEIIHCIFSNEKTLSLPTYLKEGMTELLVNEYFDKDSIVEENSYIYEILLVKLLSELTSPDIVLKTYSTGDKSELIKELSKNSKYKVKDVENILNNVDKMLYEKEEIDKDIYNELILLLNNAYENKKIDSDFDIDNTRYLIELFKGISTESRYLTYFENLTDRGVSNKIYFNNRLKKDSYTFSPYYFESGSAEKAYFKY